MINKVYLFVSVLLSAMAFTACTTDFDVHLDSMPPVLVVDAVVTTDTTTHYVYLKTTGSYFSSQPADVVSGAIVTLDDGQHVISVSDEYELIYLLGLFPVDQRFVYSDCDFISVAKNRMKINGFYFNIKRLIDVNGSMPSSN